MSVSMKCPKCGSSTVARSHRRIMERFLPGIKPYRCTQCNARFRVFRGIFVPK